MRPGSKHWVQPWFNGVTTMDSDERNRQADIIDRFVERRTDRIDALYMSGKLTTEEYERAMRGLNEYAEREYARICPKR